MTAGRRKLVWRRAVLGAAGLCGVAGSVLAAGQFIEDIQVSRRGDEATITISLACPMRFQSDVVTPAGVLLEIRVAPLDSCRQLGIGDGIASEVYRPVSGRLANLVEVEYESLGLGDNLLLLRFDRPVSYRVAQRGDLRTLELRVRTEGVVPVAPVAPPLPPPAETRAPPPAEPPSDRAPLTARVRSPEVVADYMINLQSTREPVGPEIVAAVQAAGGQRPYVSTTAVAGVTWYRLRLGFFASEAEAAAALTQFAARFPRAWIGRAEVAEVLAANDATEPGGIVAANEPAVAAPAPTVAGGALSPERIEELLATGRAAIVAGDFEGAIRIYTRLLEEPGEHRPEARENLGLAREKNGQAAHAAAEYRRFLDDYPDSAVVARVRQRLNGLVTASVAPRDPLRSATAEGRWDFTTGVSQYYRRDLNRFDEDQPEVVTLSALLTDLDVSVKRSGESIDLLGRLTVNHLHDLIGEDDGGPGDRQRISYAYLDVSGVQDDWSVRLGRQSLHNWGVLGRFDGAHATYDWAEDRRVHAMVGYPVESSRNSVETDRQFIGAAVDFDNLIGDWSFSPFVSEQTIAGISDRRAAGLEVNYVDEQRSLTTMLDYDFDYGEINTALVFGTWRLRNRITLTALYDERSSPVLTTRNALIGQPVSTIDELLLVWTEDEIRQIARERTMASRTVTFGVAAPLAERWQVNADVTMTEMDASVASAGVAAVPGTGLQTYYSTSLVGSALFGGNDVSIFNIRYGESDEFTTAQLTWDLRLPVGRKLRINPRLRLGVYEGLTTNRRRETVTPSLRLLLNTARHYRLELEVGTDRMKRSDGAGEQDATGSFFNVGYRADF
jgi:tetratricopeptide (TPR) repeat protein